VPIKHATPATPTLPAAPVLEVEVAFALELALLAWEVVALVSFVEVAPVAEELAVAPMGAVDWPLISAWTVELKVPVMLVNVNLAEKASAGYWALVASFRLSDWKRMK